MRELLMEICANRDDDTVRLAYADWLEENGDGDRAAFIRLQVELAGLGDPPARFVRTPMSPAGPSYWTFDADEVTAKAGQRVDVERDLALCRRRERGDKRFKWYRGLVVTRVEDGDANRPVRYTVKRDELSARWPGYALRRTCRELLRNNEPVWLNQILICLFAGQTGNERRIFRYEWRRGFLDSVTISFDDWCRVCDVLTYTPGRDSPCVACWGRVGDWRASCRECDGTGRVSCSPCANPIRTVRLTTNPILAIRPHTGEAHLIGRGWVNVGFDKARPNKSDLVPVLLTHYWPRITFKYET